LLDVAVDPTQRKVRVERGTRLRSG
jgi:hypothetical protein